MASKMTPSIYEFVKTEENRYESEEIKVGDNWNWNMRNHIQLIFHLRNGVFYKGENDLTRAFKEVMNPMIELSNWTEDMEAKDTTFFIEGKDDRVASFLIKKFHDEVYTHKYDLDKLYDEVTESDNTYGGVIVQDAEVPEVIKLKRIAFCDQTDILGGPLAFKMNMSPSKLRQMAKRGWGKSENGATISIQDLIIMAEAEKTPSGSDTANKTTGKSIEVYITKGDFPAHYLEDNDNMEDFYHQLHIIAYYTNKEDKKIGVTLYRKKADESDFKFFTSSEVEERGLGRGVGEKLIQPQIWTNFSEIHKMAMLEAGSKVPLWTDDEQYTTKNKIQDMENLEITTVQQGRKIGLVPTISPANIQLHEKSITDWYSVAQNNASAFDPLMGKEESAGTTFRGQERLVAQGRGPHDRRRGKRAKFMEEIYRDFIIPRMKREILKGKKFLASLTSEELNWVTDQWARRKATMKLMDDMFDGKLVTKEEQDQLFEQYKNDFLKSGNKKLLEIVADEMDGVEIRMGINISGKQKNLANLSDKLLSIFQFIFSNPQAFLQAMQIPALSQSFQDILEFSGLNQADFMSLVTVPKMLNQPQQQTQPTEQTQELALPTQ